MKMALKPALAAVATVLTLTSVGAFAAVSASERTVLRCEPVYLPSRAVWPREVELLGKAGRLAEVRIDGLPVYSFAVDGTLIMTSLDNERIQIDFEDRTWRSDFRGQATSQGLCDLVDPAEPK